MPGLSKVPRDGQGAEPQMRILVMGAGAIGSAVGGFMARAGHTVTLVGRANHMHAIRERGLRISGIWGEHCVTTLDARTSTVGLEGAAFDLVVITVKSFDTARAVEEALPVLGEDTLVCAYQNGLGNAETIAAAVGWRRTVGARAIFGVRMDTPGCAEVTVIANPTALGVLHPEAPSGRVHEIVRLMDAAGLPTVYSDRIATVLWGKVAYNCALNPLSALLDVPYGRLAESAHTRAIMDAAIEELYAVGDALGIELDPETPEAYQRQFYEELIPPTAAHYASMRADLVHGKKTEIDALNGAIVRYGEEQGVACPVNTLLTRLIHAHEDLHG